ncbi:MAG: glycosyltransferase family 4 protein [Solirubrobacterales bacterium]|nr:glycosyltransferase family 4 protein [Solirubrobacterales bacterium]
MDPDTLAAAYPRAAISHEWLTVPGGSEKVVLAILELLPHAELIASVYDPAPWPPELTGRPVHTTFVNRIPGARTRYPKLLPFMDAGFRRMDVSGYDLVVSSSHACAKNVRARDGKGANHPVHVCYCHTPMRYAWDPGFLDGEDLGRVGTTVLKALLPQLRRADLRGAKQVDHFVANSTVVAARIAEHYGRESTVVHPPVDVAERLTAPRRAAADAPYLFFGRVVPYKRADLAVEACRRLGRPLVVAGGGRDLERVKAMARGADVTFRGRVSEAELAELLATSRALLFPGEEDFGIVPVEAQAAGLPVIGNADGGVRDSVDDGVSGVRYTPGDDPAGALVAALERFEGLALDEAAVRDNARPFAPERFAERFGRVLADAARTR